VVLTHLCTLEFGAFVDGVPAHCFAKDIDFIFCPIPADASGPAYDPDPDDRRNLSSRFVETAADERARVVKHRVLEARKDPFQRHARHDGIAARVGAGRWQSYAASCGPHVARAFDDCVSRALTAAIGVAFACPTPFEGGDKSNSAGNPLRVSVQRATASRVPRKALEDPQLAFAGAGLCPCLRGPQARKSGRKRASRHLPKTDRHRRSPNE
jgi:hypothetical protein